MNTPHISDNICDCEFCTMLDVMSGDPQLNFWEKEFIKSASEQGRQKDYSEKQKQKIRQIFLKQKSKYEGKR